MTTKGFSRSVLLWTAVVLVSAPSLAGVRTLPIRRLSPRLAVEPFVPGEVLVRYRSEAGKHTVDREAVRAMVGGALRRSYTTLPDLESLALASGETVEEALETLRNDPRVAYAEPNFRWTVHAVPNDAKFDQQWGLDNQGQEIGGYPGQAPGVDVDAPEAWEHGTGRDDVVVADLDEGCDFTHPDLAANIWTNPGEVAGNGVDDDGNGFVDDLHGWDFLHDDASTFDGASDDSNTTDFHGTHTSGTIGAVGNNGIGVAGVCWTVKIMTLKFLEGIGDTDDAVAAIDYALALKARGVNLRAINCSWGGSSY